MADMVIVGSKVRKLVKKQKMNMASDFLPALNKVVMDLIVRKANVAKAYGKKTLSQQAFGLAKAKKKAKKKK
jgi:hypothetical protein